MGTQRNRLGSLDGVITSVNNGSGLTGPYWSATHICPILSAMVVAKQAGVQMMKEYFEIEESKSTPKSGFRKGLKLFGNEGYQAAKNKLEANLLGRGCINNLSWKDFTWDIRKQALAYFVFL